MMRVSQGTLSVFMKIQAIAFLVYGLAFFLIPDDILTILQVKDLPPSVWPRTLGAAFIGVAVAEYLCDRRLSERLDLVWPFVVIPGLILVAHIWERAAGTYEGSELLYWSSGIAVAGLLTVAVGGLRLLVGETEPSSGV
jgi:hypothetical protein